MPQDWQPFTHKKLSLSIAYPPGWVATERDQFALFNPVDADTSYYYFQVSNRGRDSGIPSAQLLDQSWERLQLSLCDRNGRVNQRYEGPIGNARFPILETACTKQDHEYRLLIAAGVQAGDQWEITIIAPISKWISEYGPIYTPMLGALRFGGASPAASAGPAPTVRPQPVATLPAPTPAQATLRPITPIPPGWPSYTGLRPPFAIAYPPDWSVEVKPNAVSFEHPNGITGVIINALGDQSGTPNLEQLQRDYLAAVTADCSKTQSSGDGEGFYGGVRFITQGTSCRVADGDLWLFIAVGIDRDHAWGFLTVETVAQTYASIDAYFDPMLATLNFGGQAIASPSPSALPPPTATRATATTTPRTGVPPRSTIPAGWRGYSGTMVPFAIAYPPDWRVDDTNQVQGHVNFIAPDGVTTIQIRQAGSLTATLGIDRLRETYMADLSKQCGVPARAAGYNIFAGIRFAALRIDCTASGKTIDLYYGTGIKDGNEWTISLIAPAGAWEEAATRFFGPILDTLNISDTP